MDFDAIPKALVEADQKREEVYQKSLPELEKLHKKECNCKEWNGNRLVFKEAKK